MAALTSFLRSVYDAAPAGPEPLAIRALRESAIEFCEITHGWQYSPLAMDVVAGQATYTPVLPAAPLSSRVSVFRSVRFRGRPLSPAPWTALEEGDEDWGTATGPVSHYTTANAGQSVVLVAVPEVSEAGALRVRLALVPDRGALEVPDFLFADHEDAIANGAKFRLLQASDVRLSLVYRQRFLSEASRIANTVSQGRTGMALRVKGYSR